MSKLAIEDLKPGMIVHRQPCLWEGDRGDGGLPTLDDVESWPTAVVILRHESILCFLDCEDNWIPPKGSHQGDCHLVNATHVSGTVHSFHQTREEALRAGLSEFRREVERDVEKAEAWTKLIAVDEAPAAEQ